LKINIYFFIKLFDFKVILLYLIIRVHDSILFIHLYFMDFL